MYLTTNCNGHGDYYHLSRPTIKIMPTDQSPLITGVKSSGAHNCYGIEDFLHNKTQGCRQCKSQ